MIVTLGHWLPDNFLGVNMKIVPEWIQASVAVLLIGGSIGGMYAANQASLASLEARLGAVERQQELTRERSLEVLGDLATSVDKLSLSVARLDERLKAVEKEEGR